eukprot:364906-Chlamydomonas_euryale.AAC.3
MAAQVPLHAACGAGAQAWRASTSTRWLRRWAADRLWRVRHAWVLTGSACMQVPCLNKTRMVEKFENEQAEPWHAMAVLCPDVSYRVV